MRPRPARFTPSTSGSDMARKGILLLSGGFDSPVAGHLMSRQGLVTGENLGQVSSQTLASLRAIDAIARRPVLRPLIGFDKQEIVDRAKEIGTYEVSKGPEICDLLGPPRPSTHARLDQILGEEAKLDLDRLVASSLRGVVAERFKADGPARRVPTGMRTAA